MAPTLQALGIDRLSVEDRLTLVHAIWDSIAEDAEPLPLSDELKEILDRRRADLDAHPDNVLTWEEIKRHVRGGQ